MDLPIRVLQVVTQMNRAGLESRLMDIYRNIDRTKVQFDFYTCRESPGFFDDEIRSLGGNVYYGNPLCIQDLLSIHKRFRTFLTLHNEYNIVHCHLNQWCGYILKGAKEANVPIRIAHSRTSLKKNSLRNTVKNLLKANTNKYATHKFAVSEKAGEWLFGRNAIKNHEVTILPNAIDCEKFKYNEQKREIIRQQLDLQEKLTLIHVGNLRPEKNHTFLLKIFEAVRKKNIDAILLIIGADLMDGKIQREAEKAGLSGSIRFLGARSDIADLLQAGDVFIFPSIYEGFPGAVLEAEAAGLPCIISDTITDEVCITNEVVRMSLNEPAIAWANKALELVNTPRCDEFDIILQKGYDIKTLVINLTDFYIQSEHSEKRG